MAKTKKEKDGATASKAPVAASKAKSDTSAKKTEPQAPKAKKAGKLPGAPSSAPLIDTSLAAKAAANMVVNRDKLGAAKPQAAGEKPESGSFKQLKESFLK